MRVCVVLRSVLVRFSICLLWLCGFMPGRTALAERGQLHNLLTPPHQLQSKSLVLSFRYPISRSFDLATRSGLEEFANTLGPILRVYEKQEEKLEAEREELKAHVPLSKMSQKQLHAYFSDRPDVLNKRD